MEQTPHEKFTPYPYLTRTPGNREELGTYLVYASRDECKRVQAHSASEAIQMSGFKNPLKITRYDPMNMAILPLGRTE